MKKNSLFFLTVALLTASFVHAEEGKVAVGSNGISIPVNYKDFRLIGVSQRSDDQTLRAILGNDVAIAAARAGKTNPWPNGTILAKLGWKHKPSDKFAAATIPGDFTRADFMIKDDVKYAATGGWGWGRWIGLEQKPTDKPDFAQECVACHSIVKDQDLVFTKPVQLP
jgi:hypothetical protein